LREKLHAKKLAVDSRAMSRAPPAYVVSEFSMNEHRTKSGAENKQAKAPPPLGSATGIRGGSFLFPENVQSINLGKEAQQYTPPPM